MNTEERIQAIRARLKEMGLTRRQVTARKQYYSLGSSITVTVNDPDVDYEEIREEIQKFEKVDRCEITGEILNGGNCYVFVKLGEPARRTLINRGMPSVNIAIDRLQSHSPEDDYYEDCLGGLIGWANKYRHGYDVRFKDKTYQTNDPEQIALFLMRGGRRSGF